MVPEGVFHKTPYRARCEMHSLTASVFKDKLTLKSDAQHLLIYVGRARILRNVRLVGSLKGVALEVGTENSGDTAYQIATLLLLDLLVYPLLGIHIDVSCAERVFRSALESLLKLGQVDRSVYRTLLEESVVVALELGINVKSVINVAVYV